jgi:hypothetical protein
VIGLNPGSARTALRRAVLTAQQAAATEETAPKGDTS